MTRREQHAALKRQRERCADAVEEAEIAFEQSQEALREWYDEFTQDYGQKAARRLAYLGEWPDGF